MDDLALLDFAQQNLPSIVARWAQSIDSQSLVRMGVDCACRGPLHSGRDGGMPTFYEWTRAEGAVPAHRIYHSTMAAHGKDELSTWSAWYILPI